MHNSRASNHSARSRPRFAKLLLISVYAVGVTALSHAADVEVNVEQVIAELRRTEQALSSFTVTIDFDSEVYMSRPIDRPIKSFFLGQWTIDGRRARYDGLGAATHDDATAQEQRMIPKRWVGVFNGEVARMLTVFRETSSKQGAVDISLDYNGIRPEAFTVKFFDKPVSELIAKRTASVVGYQELNGFRLLVVETPPSINANDERKYQFWVDPNRGFAIHKRAALIRHDDEQTWRDYTRTLSSDFEEVSGGVWLPTLFSYESFQVTPGDDSPVLLWRYKGRASRWRLKPPVPDSMFEYGFPVGTFVHDRRQGANPETWTVGQTDGGNSGSVERDPLYDPDSDAEAAVEAALSHARTGHKHVLIMFGGNWCGWCYKLHDLFQENTEIAKVLSTNYELVLVDSVVNGELLQRYVEDELGVGFPFLTVLDADGRVLVNQGTAALEGGDRHDPAKVRDFLEQWRPRAPTTLAEPQESATDR